MPVVLLVITAVVQMVTWQHAVHMAQAAASRGVQTARVLGGTDAAGRSAAAEVASQFSALKAPDVLVSRQGGTVRVEVRATTPSLLGVPIPIDAVAEGPVEVAP